MKKLIFITFFLVFTAMAFQSEAQSIHNTSWRAFVGGPINDSVTINFHGDSSSLTKSNGEILVRSTCHISGDTVAIMDYDGRIACADMLGIYTFSIQGNSLLLAPVNDPCIGRMRSISGTKLVRVP